MEINSTIVENETGSSSSNKMAFQGTALSLFGIHIKNIFLTIITFGVYYFWGKTRIRKYIYTNSEFIGDSFGYHGTGKELLFGFFKLAGLFIAYALLNNFLIPAIGNQIIIIILNLALSLVVFGILLPTAIVGSRRYRLGRTSWRGIRFSFRGKVADLIKIYFKGILLTIVTLGFYYPWLKVQSHEFVIGNSYFGTRKFTFKGEGSDLMGIYMRGFFISILSLIVGTLIVLVLSPIFWKGGYYTILFNLDDSSALIYLC